MTGVQVPDLPPRQDNTKRTLYYSDSLAPSHISPDDFIPYDGSGLSAASAPIAMSNPDTGDARL
jgi:hypothetical protein